VDGIQLAEMENAGEKLQAEIAVPRPLRSNRTSFVLVMQKLF
jgi:hypothetical protein